jgi:hypothetical protein
VTESAIAHDPDTIGMLRQVLDDAWATLPRRLQTQANKAVIAQELLKLAAEGERDPTRLCVRSHPIQGRPVHPERAGNIDNSIPSVQPLDHLATLMSGKLERSPETHAASFGSLAAFAGPDLDESEREAGAGLLHRFQHIQQVAGGAGQPVALFCSTIYATTIRRIFRIKSNVAKLLIFATFRFISADP